MAYTVKKGDTLSQLYGKDWQKLSGYTGDPTKLQIGTQLNDLPGAPAPAAPLGGTQVPQPPTYLPQEKTTNPTGEVNPATGQLYVYGSGNKPSPIVTPPPPPKVVEPTPYQSETTTGQATLKALQDGGFKTDYQSLMKTYRDYGLEGAYGSFTGTNEQYNAIRQKAIEDTTNKLNQYKGVISEAEKAGYAVGDNKDIQTKDGKIVPYSASNAPTKEFVNPTPADYESVTQDILDSIGTTDLTKLIQDFAGGEITTPELELTKEDRDAKLAEIKSVAAAGLATIQKSLAARGMTFSGIRTTAEANQAAEVLAKEAGIGREFAGKIINAARQEQTRRETALTKAEDNYNDALKAQGYVYNPITNSIEKTLERQRFESSEDKEAVINNPASYDEWELAGGQQGTGMSYAKWLDRNVKATGGTTASEKNASETLDRVMEGDSIWELTPTERTNVKNQAYKMGLYKTTPPTWFKDFVLSQSSVTEQFTPYSPEYLASQGGSVKTKINDSTLKQMWDEYRAPIFEKKPDKETQSLNSLIDEETGGE